VPPPVPAPVWSDAINTSFFSRRELEGDGLVQWSATFVAAVTLNCLVALLLAVPVPVLELEFIPEFAPAEAVPEAVALAPA
jgi:hypothetical protein